MTEESKALTASTPEDRAVAEVRKRGAAEVAHRREIKELDKIIHGMSFGTVEGSSFSPQTRWQIAKYCEITGAEPMTQVDILGGKPYLNAAYWADNLINQERFHHYEQREIGAPAEEALRARVAELEEITGDLEGQEKAKIRLRMFDLMEEADLMAHDRAFWQARSTATSVVETTIWRFINQAPMDTIRAGKVTDINQYKVPVKECNWAGGMADEPGSKKDPVGDANPGTSARTRSLRRCATKAFSAWMGPYRERIEEAEKAIEAEFEIITTEMEEVRDSLPEPGGPQAVSSAQGEPEAVNPDDAQELPFEGVEAEPVENQPEPEKKKVEKKKKPLPPDDQSFDRNDARKALFATLRDAGVSEPNRKAWQKLHDLPESTSEWGKDEYGKAIAALMDPVIERVTGLCGAADLDLGDLSLKILNKDAPQYLKDWNTLDAHLQAEMAGSDL